MGKTNEATVRSMVYGHMVNTFVVCWKNLGKHMREYKDRPLLAHVDTRVTHVLA